MIVLREKGIYRLERSRQGTLLLLLSQQRSYAWIMARGIGDVLLYLSTQPVFYSLLASGIYRYYAVENEPRFTDLYHLELATGRGLWQGYLMLHEFPDPAKRKIRIIPTRELITRTDDRHFAPRAIQLPDV